MGTARDGDSKPRRVVRGGHEAWRLEEQLWTLVFEELWPTVSRSTRRGGIVSHRTATGEVGRAAITEGA